MLQIRFNRVGKKNRAIFRIALQEHTIAPGGRHVEILGSWDPHQKKGVFKGEKIKEWIKKGAQVTDSVWNILIRQGIIEGKKRAVKIKKKKSEGEKIGEKTQEMPKEEKKEAVPEAKKEETREPEKNPAGERSAATEKKDEAKVEEPKAPAVVKEEKNEDVKSEGAKVAEEKKPEEKKEKVKPEESKKSQDLT